MLTTHQRIWAGLIWNAILTASPARAVVPLTVMDADVGLYGGVGWTTSMHRVRVAFGDVSGDAIADVALMALDGDRAWVKLGPLGAEPTIDLAASADVTYHGGLALDLAIGDVNGDGAGNLVIVGERPTLADAGLVAVFFGPLTGPTLGTPDVSIVGRKYHFYGGRVALADLTGDGVVDIAVTQPSSGRVDLLFGRPSSSWPVLWDVTTRPPDVQIHGLFDDGLGDGLATVDVSGDGLADLILGEPRRDPDGRFNAGRVVALFGRSAASWPAIWNLAGGTGARPPDVAVIGANVGDGLSVAGGGDLDGDAGADLILAARFASGPAGTRLNAGEMYALYGPLVAGTEIDLLTDPVDLHVLGGATWDHLSVAAVGDVFGSVGADLVLGAPDARTLNGIAYVFAGPIASGTTLDLAVDEADLEIRGSGHDDGVGWSLYAADVSGDGKDDLVVGLPWTLGPFGFSGGSFVYLRESLCRRAPADAVIAGTAVVCPGDPVSLDASTSTGCDGVARLYRWRTDAAIVCDWSASPVCLVNPKRTTDYTLEVACDGEPECRDEAATRVTVEPQANAPADLWACVGTLTLDGGGSIGCADREYRWLEGATELCGWSTVAECDVSFTATSTYTLEVRCAASPACQSTDTVVVNLDTVPPDLGNVIHVLKAPPRDIVVDWSEAVLLPQYNLYRGISKDVWPALPLIGGTPTASAVLVDELVDPAPRYFYRVTGIGCTGTEGP